MADAIKVTMEPTNFKVAPGGSPATVRLSIQNAGTIVDQYTLQISDLADGWYTLPRTSVALFPGDKDALTFQLHPPAGISTRAGTYPFTVSIISQADPRQVTRIPATLVVPAIDAFELDMTPRKVIGRKGRFTITLRNGGNADLEVLLEAVDSEEACNFRLSAEEAHLEPGQKETVRLLVKPRRGGMIGQRQEFRFDVRGKPGQGAAKTVQGQIVHTPRLRGWKGIRRLGTLAALVGVLAYFYVAEGQMKGIQQKLGPFKKAATDWSCVRVGILCGTVTPTVSATPIFTFTPTIVPSGTPVPTSPPATSSGGSGGSGGGSGGGGAGGSGGGGGGGGGGAKGTPVTHPVLSTATPRPTPTAQLVIKRVATPAKPATPTNTAVPTDTPIPTSTPAPTDTQAPTDTPIPTSTTLALPAPARTGSPAAQILLPVTGRPAGDASIGWIAIAALSPKVVPVPYSVT